MIDGPRSEHNPLQESGSGNAGPRVAVRVTRGLFGGMGWMIRVLLKIVIVLVVLAIGLFVGGFFQFAHTVTSYEMPAEPRATQAVVALTGGSARIAKALDLMAAKRGEALLISGVNPDTTKASLSRLNERHAAIFKCCVEVESAALDTLGNAVETRRWMKRKGYTSLTLVTSDYHMPRSLLEFSRAAPALSIQPYPVKLPSLEQSGWYRDPETLRFMISEYLKYIGALGRDYFTPKRLAALRASVLGE